MDDGGIRTGDRSSVPKELGGGTGEGIRMAVVRFPSLVGAAPRGIVIDIVDDHEIEPTVAIIVHKASRASPQHIVQARFVADVGEGAIAIVENQPGPTVLT